MVRLLFVTDQRRLPTPRQTFAFLYFSPSSLRVLLCCTGADPVGQGFTFARLDDRHPEESPEGGRQKSAAGHGGRPAGTRRQNRRIHLAD